MKVYIYGLVDPRDGKVRYVGKSINPKARLNSHLYYKGDNHPKDEWLNELKDNNLIPEIKIIDECDECDWESRERYWIAEYRKKEPRLTNIADGGNYGELHYPRTGQKHECFICRGSKNEMDSICRFCPVSKERLDEEKRDKIAFDEYLEEEEDKELSNWFAEFLLKN